MTMSQNYLLSCILFIPLIIAHNKTTVPSNSSTENIDKSESKYNKKYIPVLSEGGPTILLNTSSLGSSKDNNYDALLGIEELAKEKPVATSVPKIYPRKGVKYFTGNSTDVYSKNQLIVRQDTTTNHTSKTVSSSESVEKNVTKIPNNLSKPSSFSSKDPVVSKNQSSITPVIKLEETHTEKPVPKKPLILSYEKLDKMDVSTATPVIGKIPVLPSSPKSILTDQIASSKTEPPVTVKSAISRGHPEMVIPVVITMIAVPVFAVLGYMALKRGKEAWRNRHYKRMDYLIDEMYNDQ